MTPTAKRTGGKTALSWMFFGLAITLALWYGRAQYTEAKERAEAERAKAVQQAAEYARNHPPQQRVLVPTAPEDPEYARSGEGYAKKAIGLKVWLDPRKSYTRPSGPARYVVENHPTMYCDESVAATAQIDEKKWRGMPAGRYIVYPIGADEVFFRWWQ